MKTEFELIRLTKANEYLNMAITLLHHNDVLIIKNIIKSNSDKINYHNKQKLDVINPTKKELGSVSSSLKKIVLGYYSDYINKIKALKKRRELIVTIHQFCNKTVLPQSVLNSKILLSRQQPNYYSYNNLEVEMNEYLKLKMLESFNEQNKDFIKTRILLHTGA